MPAGNTEFQDDTSLGSGETDSYTLNVVWLDDDDTEIETESIASGVAGGTQTTFDVPARSPNAKIEVTDAGAGSGAYDLTAHLR